MSLPMRATNQKSELENKLDAMKDRLKELTPQEFAEYQQAELSKVKAGLVQNRLLRLASERSDAKALTEIQAKESDLSAIELTRR